MKKPTDDLFMLVKSLSSVEQANFKKFSRRHAEKDNTHFQLFEAIKKQEQYNEPELLRLFKDLAVRKIQLYELVLQSMMSYSLTASSVNAILDRNIIFSKLLFRKGLLNQGLKMLRKTMPLAEENHSYEHLIMMLGLEMTIAQNLASPEQIWEIATTWQDRLTAVHKKTMNVDVYLAEQKKVRYVGHLKERSLPYEKHLRQINVQALEDKKGALTDRAENFRLSTLCSYYALVGEHEKAFKTAAENLKANEKLHKQRFPKHSHVYFGALDDYIRAAINSGHYPQATKALTDLQKIPHINDVYEAIKDIHCVFYRQRLFWLQGKFDEGWTLSKSFVETYKWKEKTALYPDMVYSVKAQHLLLAFVNKQWQEAYLVSQDLFMMNKEMNLRSADLEITVFNLLLQTELENYNLVKNTALSIKRKLKGKRDTDSRNLLQFVKAVEVYQGVSTTGLKQFVKSVGNLMLFDLLSVSKWATAKAEGKPLATLL